MWVDVEGGRLFVQESGVPQAGRETPILLLHGWALDQRVFDPQAAYLARFRRVIGVDRRGFGRSTAPAGLRRETDDVDRILDALSIDRVHLLGMSQGARIALRFAVMRPGRVRSLILQGPAVDGFAPEDPGAERIPVGKFATLARTGRMDEVRRLWLAHPMMSPGDGHAALRPFLETITDDYGGGDLLTDDPEAVFFSYSHDMLSRLGNLAVPTLVLTGARETSARRAHARKLVDVMPSCREIVLGGSGHLSNLTEPDAYNREVLRFCAEAEERPPAECPGRF